MLTIYLISVFAFFVINVTVALYLTNLEKRKLKPVFPIVLIAVSCVPLLRIFFLIGCSKRITETEKEEK